MHVSLPPFQYDGVRAIREHWERGIICWDDVGTGKTFETVVALNGSLAGYKAVLCPPKMKGDWAKVVRTVTGADAYIHIPKSQRRKKDPTPPTHPQWFIGGYDDAEAVYEKMGVGRSFALVIDELHNIRGYTSKRLKGIKRMRQHKMCQGIVGVSGSPVYNRVEQNFEMLGVIRSGQLGGHDDFGIRYSAGYRDDYGYLKFRNEATNTAELADRLAYFSFRRTFAEVKHQLSFDMQWPRNEIDDPTYQPYEGEPGQSAAVRLIEARKHAAIAKEPHVLESVEHDRAVSKGVLVFTWLRESATRMAARIDRSLLVLGGGSAAKRAGRITDYVSECAAAGIVPVVVGTMDALGEGLNLQWANVAHLAALDWIPDKMIQAAGRIARMGQTSDVIIRLHILLRSPDEFIADALRAKTDSSVALSDRDEDKKEALGIAVAGRTRNQVLQEMYAEAMAAAK